MSGESIDLRWDESITKLKQLIQQEDAVQTIASYSIPDAFHHFSKLYIQYTIIASDLNSCYEACIQPQKRQDIKVTLEHILVRVLNLRHLLVKWCPLNPDVVVAKAARGGGGGVGGGGGGQAPFPWEYFDINKEMREMSCPPSRLEMVTPFHFGEDQKDAILHRNSSVVRIMQEKLRSEANMLESKVWAVEDSVAETDTFLHRSRSTDPSNQKRSQKEASVVESNCEIAPEQAAITIQPIVRGHFSRNLTSNARQWLERFVGLRVTSNEVRPELNKIEKNLTEIQQRRKQEQQYCKVSYDSDLLRLMDVVREEEGFAMQNELREERIKWITEQTISNNALPVSFEGFYVTQDEPNEANEPKLERDSKDQNVKGAKSAVRTNKNKLAEAELLERPVLRASLLLLDPIKHCVQIYDERWKQRNVGPGRILSQHHDVELAKSLIIRDQVKSELTKKIEEKLLSNILKINAVQDVTPTIAKKSKTENKDNGETQKANAGKKAKMKERPLPGEVLYGLKDMSVDEMLGVLVQNGLIFTPKGFFLKDYIGGFDIDRPMLQRRGDQVRTLHNEQQSYCH
jgi:hypothetical protein